MPSHRSPCWRLSQPQTEIGWMSASQTSSVLGRRLRRLFTKDEPLPRVSLSSVEFIGCRPLLGMALPRPSGYPPSDRPPSSPAVAPLLAHPERTEGTVRPFEEIFALLVRASHVPLTDRHRPDPVPGEEVLHLLLDLRVRRHVGRHPSPDDRLGGRRRDHTGCDLGRGLVVGAVKCHGADGVLGTPLRLTLKVRN